MAKSKTLQAFHTDKGHEEMESKTLFGFWTYLMTDCILFAVLFVVYIVLHNGTNGGISAKDFIRPHYALAETFVLLGSSFAFGIAMLPSHWNNKKKVSLWLFIAFLLALAFIYMEIAEFSHLIAHGNNWQRSAFLSSYFTLVGTHGFHVLVGLIWMIVFFIPFFKYGPNLTSHRRFTCLRYFWHFLDIIWIFMYTVVYLLGVI